MGTIDRKVMLVTGGTGSIGTAVAKEAAAQGWAVVVHGRSEAKAAALARLSSADGSAAGSTRWSTACRTAPPATA